MRHLSAAPSPYAPAVLLLLLLAAGAPAQFTWPFPPPGTEPQPQGQPQPQPQPQAQPQAQPQPQAQGLSGQLADLLLQGGLKGVTVRDERSCVVGVEIQETKNRFSVHVWYTDDGARIVSSVFLPYKVQEAEITPAVWRKLGGDWNCTLGPAHAAYLNEGGTFCTSSGWPAATITPAIAAEMVLSTAVLADTVTEDLKRLMNVQ